MFIASLGAVEQSTTYNPYDMSAVGTVQLDSQESIMQQLQSFYNDFDQQQQAFNSNISRLNRSF